MTGSRSTAIVVENVVEATKWVGWNGWCQVMADLGYQRQVLSHNSMHHAVPQSRDRIYIGRPVEPSDPPSRRNPTQETPGSPSAPV